MHRERLLVGLLLETLKKKKVFNFSKTPFVIGQVKRKFETYKHLEITTLWLSNVVIEIQLGELKLIFNTLERL